MTISDYRLKESFSSSFLSWIEVIKDGRIQLFYLTDSEVFSKRGQKLLKDYLRKNLIFCHEAIRDFFELDAEEGDESRVKYFWNVEQLPQELAEKVNEFDRHWGKMFSNGYFGIDQLCDILYDSEAPIEWRNKVGAEIFRRCPEDWRLMEIIERTPQEWKEKAWRELLNRDKEAAYCRITKYGCRYGIPEEWRNEAAEMILKKSPTKENIKMVIHEGPREWKERALKELWKKNLTNNELLSYFLISGPLVLKEKAWKRILKQKPSKDFLEEIAESANIPVKLRKKAYKIILFKGAP